MMVNLQLQERHLQGQSRLFVYFLCDQGGNRLLEARGVGGTPGCASKLL